MKHERSCVKLEITIMCTRWKKEYVATASKVILAETLSPTFVGLSFQEVAELCYTKLNLVLIAVEARKYEGGNIWINPQTMKITPNMIGLFLTNSSDAVKRAWFYCRCQYQLSVIKNTIIIDVMVSFLFHTGCPIKSVT